MRHHRSTALPGLPDRARRRRRRCARWRRHGWSPDPSVLVEDPRLLRSGVAVIIGIDLGTTYCAVAATDATGRPRVLPNRLGELTTPSVRVVRRRPDEVRRREHWPRTAGRRTPRARVALIKRRMGAHYPLTFHGVDAHAGVGVGADPAGRGRGRGCEARSVKAGRAGARRGDRARLLRSAGEARPPSRRPTWPASTCSSWSPSRSQLRCTTASPTAPIAPILVYDLGGGTFDCTVLRCAGGYVAVLATDGDSHLGGAEIDERLGDALLERLAEELRADADHPADDEALVQEAIGLAEIAKRNLASKQRHGIACDTPGTALRMDVDREMVAGISGDLVDRTMVIVERLLAAAGPSVRDRRGGAGRRLQQAAAGDGGARGPVRSAPADVDPELAVALGAAVRADRLASAAGPVRSRWPRPRPSAVLPRGVGVLVRDSNDPAGLREFVQHVLAANTPLPGDRDGAVRDDPRRSGDRARPGVRAGRRRARRRRWRTTGGCSTASSAGCPTARRAASVDVTVSVGLDGRLTSRRTWRSAGAVS